MILASMPPRARPLALLVCLVAASPAVRAAEPAPSESPLSVPAELTVEGMTYVASNAARNDVIVEAGRAQLERGEEVAELETVHARVGSFASGQRSGEAGGMELRCARGTFDLARGDLTAEGDVRGTTADGRSFQTERLVYKRDTGRVTTRAPVVIRDAFGTLRGAGFEYWVRENRFRLIGGASVVTTP
jgi:LPS export ABC transporter protein LptC